MLLTRILRTASFRLTALYTAAFAASFLLLFGLTYWIASDALTQQLKASVSAELIALIDSQKETDTKALADEITERLRSGSQPATFYLLQDRAGRKLAGNLGALPPFSGWRTLSVPERRTPRSRADEGDQREAAVLAKGRHLPGGGFLVVGAGRQHVVEAEEAIIRAFAWGAGATLLLAVLGGALMSVLFLRRLEVIDRTSRRIIAGNLSDRIPLRGSGDELDRLAENLNDMLDRIQALMEGLRQVSNDIAHDLRTPLSRARQRLDVARQDAKTVQDYEEAIDRALEDTDTALATFGALLRIAQIESGSRRSSFDIVDLSQVFEQAVATYGPVAEDLGKSIRAEISPGVAVSGDRDLLTQMVVNLVENALRHTSADAQIRVTLELGDDGPIGVVADNGPGIPEAERERVLQRFYRLDRSRATPGSGLGLALVAAIAHLHQTAVRLDDDRPGLRVELRFPALASSK